MSDDTKDARIAELEAEVERLEELLIEEREERLWCAYDAGIEHGGMWSDGGMSDAEWLLMECGLEPHKKYPVTVVKQAIPDAARRVLNEEKTDE